VCEVGYSTVLCFLKSPLHRRAGRVSHGITSTLPVSHSAICVPYQASGKTYCYLPVPIFRCSIGDAPFHLGCASPLGFSYPIRVLASSPLLIHVPKG
jgi:hypothetical protein